MSYEFFAATLPEQGRYCIATLLPSAGGKAKFLHDWFEDKESAYNFAMTLSQSGNKNIYYALGGFDDAQLRRQPNCVAIRSFFLDIDCGDEKPYATQKDGAQALMDFCTAVKLPIPTVVNSGRGLYAYWVLDEDVNPDDWKPVAQMLKDLCVHHGFHIDPLVATNQAQVLRPAGSVHRKDPTDPRPVTVGTIRPVVTFASMERILTKAMPAKLSGRSKKNSAPQPVEGLNDEFRVDLPYDEKPSAYKMANRCRQLALMRDSKGLIPEPLWYACVGLLVSTLESPEIIHKWSEGHPQYTVAETDNRIERAKQYHATTCAKLHESNPGVCESCPHNSRVNSPWSLGLPDPAPVTPDTDDSGVEDGFEGLPRGFSRTEKGIIHTDEDGVVSVAYPYDMVPEGLYHDPFIGQDTLHIRHKLPSGWTKATIRVANIEDRKQMMMNLMDVGLYPPASKHERGLFCMVIKGYIESLMERGRRVELPSQFGWTEYNGEKAFVVGRHLYTKDEGVIEVGISHTIAEAIGAAFEPKGDATVWADATRLLDGKKMAPWAFALAAIGFGGPLMPFTGYTGALVSMLGKSGQGKTAMGWWALSVWGNPRKLQLIQRDTANAIALRLSVHNNIPSFIDEITNIDPRDLSNLAYAITQGRDKHVLSKERKARTGLEWATIGGCSTNRSLVDVLSSLKSDASAELNRIFEYEFPPDVEFDGTAAYHTFLEHHGVARDAYVKYLVAHQHEHRKNLLAIQDALLKEAGRHTAERYWAITASCALYGAAIAKKLGLFNIDLIALREWIIEQITTMRAALADESVMGAEEWLANFLQDHLGSTLVVERTEMVNGHQNTVINDPLRRYSTLLVRVDLENEKIYINQSALYMALDKSHLNRIDVKRELKQHGLLLSTSEKAYLGKGVPHLNHIGQSRVWVIKATPQVAKRHLSLVKNETHKEVKHD